MAYNIWMSGRCYSEPSLWDFAKRAKHAWGGGASHWFLDLDASQPTILTLVSWDDGKIAPRAAVCLTEQDGSLAWAVAAESDSVWAPDMVSPWEFLGFIGNGAVDPVGIALTRDVLTLLMNGDENIDDIYSIVTNEDRICGILIVDMPPEKVLDWCIRANSKEDLDNFVDAAPAVQAHWPGVINVYFTSHYGRESLNECFPGRTLPHGGARYYAPSHGVRRDVVFSPKKVDSSPESFLALLRRAIKERGKCVPDRLAQRAFDMLSTAPPPSVDPDIPRKFATLSHELASAREREQAAVAALTEREHRLAATASLAEELRKKTEQSDLLQKQLKEISADRTVLADLLRQAENERDRALSERGRLALRVQNQPVPPGPNFDDGLYDAVTFPDLLAAAEHAWPLLRFDANVNVAAESLDQYPSAPNWRRKCADALSTLGAYAQARKRIRANGHTVSQSSTDILTFVRSSSPGSLISANIIALHESERTLTTPRSRSARTFPVEPQTDSSGQAVFSAHIKLNHGRAPAPRIYFYDDTGKTGFVYVGWVGPHLATGKTT